MKIPFWTTEPEWRDETVAILGGGPSLTRAQVEACRGRCKVIAVNTAYQITPWADALYFCDFEWHDQWKNDPAFKAFAGMKVALENAATYPNDRSIRVLRNYGGPGSGGEGLCRLPDGVYTGRSGGYQAICVAVHLGAKRILLLGFDMRAIGNRTHWHMSHKRPTAPQDYAKDMIPPFAALARDLKEIGVEVLNCTPESALTVFPTTSVEDALGMERVSA
jgi:hypothetical protein